MRYLKMDKNELNWHTVTYRLDLDEESVLFLGYLADKHQTTEENVIRAALLLAMESTKDKSWRYDNDNASACAE